MLMNYNSEVTVFTNEIIYGYWLEFKAIIPKIIVLIIMIIILWNNNYRENKHLSVYLKMYLF